LYRIITQRLKTPFLKKIWLVIFGLFLFFVLLEIVLRISGFIFISLQESRNLKAIKQNGTFRIMCLGESTTAMGGVNSYPAQLEEILNQANNIGVKFIVVNKGLGSSNTITILRDVENNLNKYKPDMVITMMGINDCAAHMPQERFSSQGKPLFFQSLKVYKLIRLIQLHITAKISELKKSKPIIDKKTTILDKDFLKTGLHKEKSSAYEEPFPNEVILKKTIELRTDDANAYLELARFYYNKDDLANAETICHKAIRLNPKNPTSYELLGNISEFQNKLLDAEAAYKKAVELNPSFCSAYGFLARCLKKQRRYSEAVEAAKKAIAINPTVHFFWAELWLTYGLWGEYREAEESIKKFIKTSGGTGYTDLIMLYCQIVNTKQENYIEYREKRDETVEECTNRFTIPNYKKIKEILDKRGIQLVCVQYPTLNIAGLRKIYAGQDNIVFVDNEMLFKDALRNLRYEELFTDSFGTSFGHCTRKGNRLLAQNIAKTILKEYFKQRVK
jgi:tetratricopeptide (TPR) repeat protein